LIVDAGRSTEPFQVRADRPSPKVLQNRRMVERSSKKSKNRPDVQPRLGNTLSATATAADRERPRAVLLFRLRKTSPKVQLGAQRAWANTREDRECRRWQLVRRSPRRKAAIRDARGLALFAYTARVVLHKG